MKKFDLPLFADVLFYTACAWLAALGIVRYFRVPLALSLVAASLIALAVGGACFALLYSRHARTALGKAAKERKQKLLLHLALERPERVAALLADALSADGKNAALRGETVTVEDTIAVARFTMEPLSADAAAMLLKEYGERPFILYCNALTPSAVRLLLSFGRTAVQGNEVFDLFERTKTAPEKLICGEIPRPKFRAKLRGAFSKKNARPFFVSGSLLLILSLFALYPVYYLTAGCVLIFAAICTRCLGFS